MPSISDALFAGRSGISSHGGAIAVLADNIANSNTTAFKQSRPEFADLIAGNLSGGGGTAAGQGSELQSVLQVFTQGTFEFTDRGLDTAIDGQGLFVVQDNAGQLFYSRAGNFLLDRDGTLRNQDGLAVLGFRTGGTGGLETLNVNTRVTQTIETTQAALGGNLDSNTPVAAFVPPATDTLTNLSNSADFSTFMSVFDSLGNEHTINLFFHHTNANEFTASAYVDGSSLIGGTAGVAELQGSTVMTFTPDGLRTLPVPAVDLNITPPWSSGANAGNIDLSFDPFTQFAAQSAIDSIRQDGTGAGGVVSFNIEPDGTLFAQLDNGQTSQIGQISLANFSGLEGLRRVGGTLFAETIESGVPVFGTPGTGRFGELQSGALELSNVSLANDFIKLISYQRGFQGSSRIINNVDDLLNEIINLA